MEMGTETANIAEILAAGVRMGEFAAWAHFEDWSVSRGDTWPKWAVFFVPRSEEPKHMKHSRNGPGERVNRRQLTWVDSGDRQRKGKGTVLYGSQFR